MLDIYSTADPKWNILLIKFIIIIITIVIETSKFV